jgi:hypothetical protein
MSDGSSSYRSSEKGDNIKNGADILEEVRQ